MALPIPELDDLSYDDLLDEARTLIRARQPQWTNLNPSDPGITLLELFAWLTEMLLFRTDQVPDRHRVVFLRLLRGPDWTLPAGSSVEDEIVRVRGLLRRRSRTVTSEDYEILANEVPGVLRARCVANRDLGSDDGAKRAATRPGVVSLVVVSRFDVVPLVPPGDAREPTTAKGVRDAVRDDLEPLRLIGTRNVVAAPVVSRVAVEILLVARTGVAADQAKLAVTEALQGFVHWTAGGPDRLGWPFGRDVPVSEIYRLLDDLPQVDYVADVMLTSPQGSDPRTEVAQQRFNDDGDLVALALADDVLPVLDPPAIVSAAMLVPITARVTVKPKPGVARPAVARAARLSLRTQFHPLHGGPTGSADWSHTWEAVATVLKVALSDLADDVTLAFAVQPPYVPANTTVVNVSAGELVDLHTVLTFSS